ncbi:hypothetical protein FJ364_03410 [Candidatus Dependentiae bacterium]|nr:hypothetical protein [Candidatus Dependentiae bacterium]
MKQKNTFFKMMPFLLMALTLNLQALEITDQAQPHSELNEIATQNLLSFPLQPEGSLGDTVNNPYAFYNFVTEAISNPQPHYKRRRAFKILASAAEKKTSLTQENILDSTTWQDLNLLNGNKENPQANLVNILSENRTHTELGKAFLCNMLARPTTNIDELTKRQAFIKNLLEDDELLNQLDDLLKKIAPHETLFTGLWDTELLMQFIQECYSKIDHIGPMINKSSLCMEIKSLMNYSAMALGVSVTAISPIVLSVYGLSMLYNGEPALEKFSRYCFGQTGLLFEAMPALKNRWTQGLLALGLGALAGFSLSMSLKMVHTVFLYDNFLRQRLTHIAAYEDAARDIAIAMLQHDNNTKASLIFFDDLLKFFIEDTQQNEDLAALADLLHTDTFTQSSEKDFSLFFSRGNVLSAYYLLSQVKERFEGLMAALGELDAFLTFAKIIKESKQTQAPWSFASFEETTTAPSISLTNFWNPFLDRETAVTNSVNLGNKFNIPNIVVTGPNSAGKSTTLKSIALAIILAQSLGIVPAQSMSLTPFSYVATYMNVSDSIIDKESRFQAEARRVFEYGDTIESLEKDNKFSFAIFDEIFSGTSPTEGASLGYQVASLLSGYNNCISIIATHFEQLTKLEVDTDKKFINFNVGVDQNSDGTICFDENGKIVRSYTLKQGISRQHIAREVFRERGDVVKSPFFEKHFTLITKTP